MINTNGKIVKIFSDTEPEEAKKIRFQKLNFKCNFMKTEEKKIFSLKFEVFFQKIKLLFLSDRKISFQIL